MNEFSSRRDSRFAFAVIAAAFLTLAAYTWRKWPEMLVDFGVQLYVPWKISTGSVLYRDIAYLVGGPFSQYYHALLFKIFGVSFMTYAMSNLVLSVLLLLALHRLFRRASDQVTASTICLSLVLAFIFAHHILSGIFSYITPYCSEIFHGLVFSVFAIALLVRWIDKGRLSAAAGAGVCAGIVFLTKPEVFLALALCLGAGVFLFCRVKENSGALIRSVAVMSAAAVLPVICFFVYFWSVWDFHGALRAVAGGWEAIVHSNTADNVYFRRDLGLDRPLLHLERTFFHCLGLAAIVALAAFLSRRTRLKRIIVILAAAGLAVASNIFFNWGDCGQSFPILCLVIICLLVRRVRLSGLSPRYVFPILWTIFALGMVFKLGLASRIWHYGFVLGMPAFAASVYLFVWLIPNELEHFDIHPQAVRAILWFPLMAGVVQLMLHSLIPYAWKTVPVAAGGDRFLAIDEAHRPMDSAMVMAMGWMKTNAPAQATVAALPANLMMNYLMRRTNPSRYPVWAPPEIAAFGEANMTRDFIQHSPDYVILIDMDYGDFGEKKFGVEDRFGGAVMKWIGAHYQEKVVVAGDSMRPGQFALKILQKNSG
jgi:hypothetical protein